MYERSPHRQRSRTLMQIASHDDAKDEPDPLARESAFRACGRVSRIREIAEIRRIVRERLCEGEWALAHIDTEISTAVALRV
jgi:hypothetical protein